MKREVKIGIFTIFIIAVAWGGIRFLSGADLFSGDNYFYAHYDQINGVQKSSAIYIKGVKIGTVSDIQLDLKNSSDVVLKLSVSNKYNIPKDSEAKIFSGGLMAPKAIEFVLGESTEYLRSGDTITASRDIDLFDMAGSELEFFKSRLDDVTDELTATLSGINTLLESNTTHIGGLIANLEALTYNINSLVETNEQNLNQTLGSFANLSQRLSDNTGNIDSIILNITALTTELKDSKIGTSLGSSLGELTTLLESLNNQEGSVAKLMSDERLYENLTSAAGDLDSLLFDMKQNPSRYVHFSIFGRNEIKQLEKAQKRADKEARKE